MAEVGKTYRCKTTGVVGKAVAKAHDPEGRTLVDGTGVTHKFPVDLVQLDLNAEHLETHPNLRWYATERLEEVGAPVVAVAPEG